MQQLFVIKHFGPLPQPFDAERTARGFERWAAEAAANEDQAVRQFAIDLAADPGGRGLLGALFGNSPFLTQCALREMAFLSESLARPPEEALEDVLRPIAVPVTGETNTQLMARLRVARRRVALLTALADIGGLWPLTLVTGALTRFAVAAVDAAVAHLLRRAAERGELRFTNASDPAPESGLAIIGMGKLGAGELNYSSDIDLMVFFDQEKVDYIGPKQPQDTFIRLTQNLVQLLQERTGDGYVFRTDLRLRPDPGATPVAISMAAAENYYESLGQNWERAAMIKARCIAGDTAAGRAFLERISPFVWRRNLDFAAIEDIHSIKRQINARQGHGTIAVLGHNIKLGRGGIREVEFFAQTQQLIAGGRDRRLRVPTTCGAIRAFAATGRLDSQVAEELIAAYEYLRRVEHRLQMIDDEQTHTLPDDDAGLAHLACFLGYGDSGDFRREMLDVLRRVQHRYRELFESAPNLGIDAGNLVFTGTEDDPETLKTLSGLGYQDAAKVAGTVRTWHHGRYRAMRSARAREMLTVLMPKLLSALAGTANPDTAFNKFDEFLAKLPAGLQLFSLFYANPTLLELVAEIMGTAPRLAELLAHNPNLFDAVLGTGFLEPLPDAEALTPELEQLLQATNDFQDALDAARRWNSERKFQVGVQQLRQLIDNDAASLGLTNLVDAVLAALIPRVSAEFELQHGRVAGGGLAVVGLGKLGAREMTFGSDLDLIFLYQHDDHAEASDGKRPLPSSQYFARLCQRIINALTALTPEGRLYDVDMRLRPSGNKGPVAVHIDGFERYHQQEAWTWERMALTRARLILGPTALRERAESVIVATLTGSRNPDRLLAEVADMRRRVAAEHPSEDPWDIKHVRGGLLDAEFLAQYLILRHAGTTSSLIEGNTARAFERAGTEGVIAIDYAAELAAAARFLRTMQALLRLCFGGNFDEAQAPAALGALLAQAGGTRNFSALRKKLQRTEKQVAKQFRAMIERPAKAHLHLLVDQEKP